jgi:hypothetical protein
MSGKKDQSAHDKLVKAVVDSLSPELYADVKGNIFGYTIPSKIILTNSEEVYIPDVTGKVEDFQYIYEVETEETISNEHTKNKWELVSDYAAKHNAIFVIVVPKGCRNTALTS